MKVVFLQSGHLVFCRCLTANFAVCCAEDAHGNLCVLLPAALLANCRQPVAHDLLPVIASQLQQVLQQPDWDRSSWPVMEWLFQEVLLAKLAKCFREAKTATLKVSRDGQTCRSGSPWCSQSGVPCCRICCRSLCQRKLLVSHSCRRQRLSSMCQLLMSRARRWHT